MVHWGHFLCYELSKMTPGWFSLILFISDLKDGKLGASTT